MPRIRYLKPDFFKDEDLALWPFETRLCFEGLWILADKEGRLEDRPLRLKVEIFPYDDVKIENCLKQLSQCKNSSSEPFIHRYTTDNQSYIQIINWKKHQKPHHTEKASSIPPPPDFPLFETEKRRKETKEEKIKGNGDGEFKFKPAQSECEVKQRLNNGYLSNKENKPHTTTSSERIISAWQRLPLPLEKKTFGVADILAIERQLSVLAEDPIEPLHEGMILETIENYGKALNLPSSQTYKHKLYPWLRSHVRKYTSYAFDIDHHNGSKFKKGSDTKTEYEKLKAKGEL